ncbi:uncharacterized protein [Rutidosis leptorrhynchoides]|uniref:uncharacterized protein n=1 Tax=Rutidosis leptorrhynchoides TaxID=125765 RepID=UPI003A98ECA5
MDILSHSRRNKSSSFSAISDKSSVTTATPATTPLRYLGIPFSWEHVPGIAKKNNYKKTESSQSLLPLPPLMKKYNTNRSFQNDPFFAAFVECSKDKEFHVGDFRKNSSNERTGFVNLVNDFWQQDYINHNNKNTAYTIRP